MVARCETRESDREGDEAYQATFGDEEKTGLKLGDDVLTTEHENFRFLQKI